MNVRPVADRGLLVELGNGVAVHRLAAAMARARVTGVVETVPGARSLLLVLDPDVADRAAVLELLPSLLADAPMPEPGREWTLPVDYDGADLADVTARTGLRAGEVVALHTGATYTVAFLGFAPGFGYLTGLDRRLQLPRLDRPRPQVPAGSVAVAGPYTAVYPAASPGGWRLLGRTAQPMFDPTRDPPALLAPGDRVRFTVA